MLPMLAGKTAVVTGAGRGIGRATALALAQAGARVIAVARTRADLDELAEEGEGRIEPCVADVRDADFLTSIEAMGELDILVNNAGGNRPKMMVDVDDETLDWMIELNIRSVYRVARAAARAMDRGGVIVNMSSQMGHVGSPKRTVYCMTKHAVEGLTKAMAVELAPRGIRVVAIAPTFVVTPMTQGMFEDPAFRQFVYDMVPLNELPAPEDIAQSILFLVSPGARFVTGDSLRVDGGWTAR
ncbi:NAD(P)-dependent dehydrogenase (short-subunit alcohol dehydrogenase family) [Ancylobacter sp. 3268]|uniref:SDR family NAD(P)-dependent oxidoreductase n=1 Tax=Ancylobacter sp. 3268 TaxID=2817752 RepID=UPI00285C0E1F|nr:SDR family oxidoreductase [Ancylobacter sp. 3268]MDR6953045.1 NAD(P)-dependent dehydrogenase (short-subunit alcohol dehydrogenase family) [Ancylobacter sp. 3268]